MLVYLLINFTFLERRGCFERILLFFLMGADLRDTVSYQIIVCLIFYKCNYLFLFKIFVVLFCFYFYFFRNSVIQVASMFFNFVLGKVQEETICLEIFLITTLLKM